MLALFQTYSDLANGSPSGSDGSPAEQQTRTEEQAADKHMDDEVRGTGRSCHQERSQQMLGLSH